MSDFKFETMFPLGEDTTEYRLLTKEHIRVREFEGREVLMVEPQALNLLSKHAFKDVAHLYRSEHLEKLNNKSFCRLFFEMKFKNYPH